MDQENQGGCGGASIWSRSAINLRISSCGQGTGVLLRATAMSRLSHTDES